MERVYLVPEHNAPIKATEGVATPTIIRWDDVSGSIGVDADQRPRLLETTENWNAGWKAHLGGIALEPFRVDGWRQAFFLPAGVGGQVELRYDPDRPYLLGLLVGLLCAISVAGLAGFRDGGRRPPAAGAGSVPPRPPRRPSRDQPARGRSARSGGGCGPGRAGGDAMAGSHACRHLRPGDRHGLADGTALAGQRECGTWLRPGVDHRAGDGAGSAGGSTTGEPRPPDADPDAPISEPVARPTTSWRSR